MVEKKTRICFIAGTLGKGGAEKQAYYITKALHENGHEPLVVYFGTEEWWAKEISDLGIKVVNIPFDSRIKRLARLFRLLRHEKIDIIQACHFYINPYVVFLSLFLRTKSVGAFRRDGDQELLTVNKYINRLTFILGNLFISNSKDTIYRLSKVKSLKPKLYHLPNVVSLPAPSGFNQKKVPLRFIAVNRLVEQKRVELILKFISLYKQQVPEVELYILGIGPLKESLEKEVDNLGLNDNVQFRGLIEDVAPYWKEADVFLFASDSEGTPNVVLEAMSYGKVVISSRTLGDADSLLEHNKTGFLIDYNSENEIGEMCNRLQSQWSELQTVGIQAHNQIKGNHQYADLYNNLRKIYARL